MAFVYWSEGNDYDYDYQVIEGFVIAQSMNINFTRDNERFVERNRGCLLIIYF